MDLMTETQERLHALSQGIFDIVRSYELIPESRIMQVAKQDLHASVTKHLRTFGLHQLNEPQKLQRYFVHRKQFDLACLAVDAFLQDEWCMPKNPPLDLGGVIVNISRILREFLNQFEVEVAPRDAELLTLLHRETQELGPGWYRMIATASLAPAWVRACERCKRLLTVHYEIARGNIIEERQPNGPALYWHNNCR